ncbi:hypothetical protein PCANB_001430 [Pneumocystis canis]|nr:hypothetical protein PCANB_001430 [Pneumocystis canis]
MIWESGSTRQSNFSMCSNGRFMDIGVVGRKTGLRIHEDIRRDSFGMEDMDAFFSQITPPSVGETAVSVREMSHRNDQTISIEQSMDVANSPSRDISEAIEARKSSNAWSERKPMDSLACKRSLKAESPWIGRSPVKTNLKSPALRVPSTQKREFPISPTQLDWSDGVARRLDFSAAMEDQDEPAHVEKSDTQSFKSVKRGQLIQQKMKQKMFNLLDNVEYNEFEMEDNAQDFFHEDVQDWGDLSKHEAEEFLEEDDDSDNKMTKKSKKELHVQKKLENANIIGKKQKASRTSLKTKKVVPEYFKKSSSYSSTESPDASPKMKVKRKSAKKQIDSSASSEDSLPATLSPRLNGMRRSSRTKVAPLAYWRNERIVYELGERRKSGPAMPKIKEIIRVNPISIPSRPRGTSRAKNTSFKKKVVKHRDTSDEEWEEKVDVECEVINWHDKKPIIKRIAYPASSYAPRDVANAIIKFQKTFDEAPFFATGVMDLPRGAEKTTKPSKHNVMTFVILEGAVEATVHQTSFRLKRGSHFIVPRGNYYSIRNIANKVSRLFFTQATDTLENEELRA